MATPSSATLEPPRLPTAPPGEARGACLFVGGVWALLLLAGLAYVARYGSNVPSWDEWDMVPTLTGEQPVTLAWLWSQHNEHRIPLPRLLLLALGRFAGADSRAAMYFSVVILGALALAQILVASRLRGRTSCSDAFFPLVLLHWGHAANFLWGWQVAQVTPTLLAGLLLLIVAGKPGPMRLWVILAAGTCLFLLPLCGAIGLALVPALTPWLVYSAVLRWRSGERRGRRDALIALSLAAAALLLVALYFVGYQKVPYYSTSPDLRTALTASVQLLSLSFGPAARPYWRLAGPGVFGLLLLSAALLALVGRGRPLERPRVLGLLLFLGAMASLALGVGWGRPYNALDSRYGIFIVPAVCCAYLVWSVYGPPTLSYLVRFSLFALMCVLLWPNSKFGVDYARHLRSRLASFEEDLQDGMPVYLLVKRHASYLHPQHQLLTEYLPLLRRAGVGHFSSLRDNPNFQEISLPVTPTAVNQVAWKGGVAYGTGDSPSLTFALSEARYVCGVRLKYSYSNEEGIPPWIQISWKRGPEDEASWAWGPTGDSANWWGGPESEKIVLIWVCDTVSQLRIRPGDRPCVFRISEIVLLVLPADHEQGP